MRFYKMAFLRNAALAVALTSFIASPLSAQTSSRTDSNWTRFMAPAALQDLLASDPSVQVLDIRSEKYLDSGLIPGAVWVTFKDFRGPSERPGEPPEATELAALLGDNGLRPDQPLVIYNHNGKTVQMGRAAIVYWLMKSAGFDDVAILHGGYKSWQDAELAQADTPADLPPQTVTVNYRRDWWAEPLDIFAVTTGQVEGAILDARLDGQVRKSIETGKPMMSMPMAQYIPASLFMNQLSDASLSPEGQAAFRAELEGRGITLGTEFLISVCATGELSALSWFYASEIVGIENVRYYPDALKGWKGDGGLMFGMATEN